MADAVQELVNEVVRETAKTLDIELLVKRCRPKIEKAIEESLVSAVESIDWYDAISNTDLDAVVSHAVVAKLKAALK